jgi:hypothetical protein
MIPVTQKGYWFFYFAAFMSIMSCGSLFTPPTVSEAAYLAEELRCVDDAGTRAQADACRAEVRKRWDAAKDGGKE